MADPYARYYRRPTPQHNNGIGLRTALCVLLCAAAFFCKQYYPRGAEVMGQVVFGTADSAVSAAFAEFSEAMEDGQPVTSCFTELCDAVFTKD